MKINQIEIENFFSYEHAHFIFNDFNVIVGPNDSGKTNLVRILDILKNSDSLEYVSFQRRLRFDPEKPSFIYLQITLSDYEFKILSQLIFQTEINEKSFSDSTKRLDILIEWSEVVADELRPQHIICKFGNGFTLYKRIGSAVFSTHTTDIKNIHNINQFQHTLIDLTSNPNLQNYEKSHGFNPSILIINDDFKNDFLKGNSIEKYLVLDNKNCFLPANVDCRYEQDNSRKYASECIEFVGANKAYGASTNFWYVLAHIFKKSIIIMNEVIPDFSDLTTMLMKLKSDHEKDYDILRKNLDEIFTGLTFFSQINRSGSQQSHDIMISHGEKSFMLKESASGYLAAINILYNILNKKDCLIILDEPETHFHPTKVSLLADRLNNLTKEKNNQIIVLTHSSRFLDSFLTNYGEYSVIRIKKDHSSTAQTASNEFVPQIQQHLFNPEVFFAECVIVVEGPSDEFVIKALSDFHKNKLTKKDIVTVNAHNWNKIDPYIDLLDQFGIPSVALADKQYSGAKSNVIKLKNDLEYELENLGWQRDHNEKIKPEEAYSITMDLLQNCDKKKLMNGDLWKIIKKAEEYGSGKI